MIPQSILLHDDKLAEAPNPLLTPHKITRIRDRIDNIVIAQLIGHNLGVYPRTVQQHRSHSGITLRKLKQVAQHFRFVPHCILSPFWSELLFARVYVNSFLNSLGTSRPLRVLLSIVTLVTSAS